MSDTIALLATRRSVPPQGLKGPAPATAEIEAMLTIASRVPDHGKLVPWRFIVIEGEGRAQLGEVIAHAFKADHPSCDEGRLAQERERLARAPVVVAVVSRARRHPKIPLWEQEMTAGAVCMALVTAARALGYATSWLTEWIAFDRRVLDAMGLAPGERIAGFVHIGRADKVPSDRERPDLRDIVTHFKG